MPDGIVRIGTRGSRLALWQTDHVVARLEAAWPGLRCERLTFSTLGDRVTDVPLPRVGERGLFTRDLEEALHAGTIDAAVHSLKDLPTDTPPGLRVGAVLERADAREVLVTQDGTTLAALPPGARLGTSSVRRRTQVLALRPDLTMVDIRGNVPTRVDKVTRGDYDGTLLARAGLERLGMIDVASEVFPLDVLLPAPGQGALAVQVRAGDVRLEALVGALDHAPSRLATTCERRVLSALRGGCQAPLGTATSWSDGDELQLAAVVASVDGRTVLRASHRAPVRSEREALALADLAAADLLHAGASAIFEECRRALRTGDVVVAGKDDA
jgi:hydroxymethylbilane synthase